jgi:hypothetical protein
MKAKVFTPVLMLLMTAGAAFAGDSEFDRIVKAIESRYGTKPVYVPFMGVANFAVKVAHPGGAAGFHLAVFEGLKDLNSPDDPGEWRERDHFMDALASRNLRQLVRVHSRHDGEATYIFMSPESRSRKSTRVLIATFEHDGATVIEVQATIETLLKSLEEPAHAGRALQE